MKSPLFIPKHCRADVFFWHPLRPARCTLMSSAEDRRVTGMERRRGRGTESTTDGTLLVGPDGLALDMALRK
jgi:hypothetical protein